MKILKTRYYHIVGEPTQETEDSHMEKNYVKAEVYYDEGGMSYFTYKTSKRGYYMSVHKVGRYKPKYDDYGGYIESTILFGNDGVKQMISEVSRQGKKKAAEAEQYFDANIDEFLKLVYPELEVEKEG